MIQHGVIVTEMVNVKTELSVKYFLKYGRLTIEESYVT
jgi:hypothetical protein